MKGTSRKYPKIVIEQKKRFGIYTLICPIKKEPIYIGCSLNLTKRYYSHLSASENTSLHKYIWDTLYATETRKLITLKVLYWTDDVEAARQKEIELIAKYNKSYKLLNTHLNGKYSLKRKSISKS